ncbi:MAG: hypothetical protein KDD25_09060, partial [Bdellovibrionales bacterium]|nr:hypothetical protein [Bdellovibrionales bacterium]
MTRLYPVLVMAALSGVLLLYQNCGMPSNQKQTKSKAISDAYNYIRVDGVNGEVCDFHYECTADSGTTQAIGGKDFVLRYYISTIENIREFGYQPNRVEHVAFLDDEVDFEFSTYVPAMMTDERVLMTDFRGFDKKFPKAAISGTCVVQNVCEVPTDEPTRVHSARGMPNCFRTGVGGQCGPTGCHACDEPP